MASADRETKNKSVQFMDAMQNKSGVYMITSKNMFVDKKRSGVNQLVKIGMAKNLQRRLDQYLLYWPESVYVFQVFTTENGRYAKRLERSIHSYMRSKNKIYSTWHGHNQEWFELSLDEIQQLIKVVLANGSTRHTPVRSGPGKRIFPFKDPDPRFPFPLEVSAKKEETASRTRRGMNPATKALIERNVKGLKTGPPVPRNRKRARGKPIRLKMENDS